MNQPPESYGGLPADTRIGVHVGGTLGYISNTELDTLVKLLQDVIRPANAILSKKQAMEFVARSEAENLVLVQRHAKLQSVLVAFKIQLSQLPEGDPLREAFAKMFDTFQQVLTAT